MQEDSCPVIGIYIFVLIVLLQNTSVKLQRIYVTPIADRLFLDNLPKQCLCAFCSICWENYPCINTVYNHFHFHYCGTLSSWVRLFMNSFPLRCLQVTLCSAMAESCLSWGSPLSAPGWPREGWVLHLGSWFKSEVLLKLQGTLHTGVSVRAALWRDVGVLFSLSERCIHTPALEKQSCSLRISPPSSKSLL